MSGSYVVDDNSNLNAIFDAATCWTDEVVIILYFATKIIEQKIKVNADVRALIQELKELPRSAFFSYQGFDQEFVEFMMSNVRTKNTTLEENILLLQARLDKYDFT
jgi:ADP-ribosylglycohydrolase